MYVYSNKNPLGRKIGDCVVRAISEALNQTWERTYADLCVMGFDYADMPNSNATWHAYLTEKGYKRYIIPDTCPDCHTIGRFADEHPQGTYIVATGTHAACVKDGAIRDNWDSSDLTATYFYVKE